MTQEYKINPIGILQEKKPTLYIINGSERTFTDQESIGNEYVRRINHVIQNIPDEKLTGFGENFICNELKSLAKVYSNEELSLLRKTIMTGTNEVGIPANYLDDYLNLLEPQTPKIPQYDSRDPKAETIADVGENHKPKTGETTSEPKRDRSKSRTKRFGSIDEVVKPD